MLTEDEVEALVAELREPDLGQPLRELRAQAARKEVKTKASYKALPAELGGGGGGGGGGFGSGGGAS